MKQPLIFLLLTLFFFFPVTGQSQGKSLFGEVDIEKLQILLLRSYLPTGGRDAVPLPEITIVKNGNEDKLPLCPNMTDRLAKANLTQLWRSLSKENANILTFLEELTKLLKFTKSYNLGKTEEFPFCAWWVVVDVDTLNIAFPDAAATYWATPLIASDDTQVIINGKYPDERYLSLTLYNYLFNPYTVNGVNSWIEDYLIEPDTGSFNPWQVEADPGGSYTVTINGQSPVNNLPFFSESGDSLGLNASIPLPAPCNTPDSPYTCTLEGMFSSPPSDAQSSVFSNPDNTYIPALIRLDRVPRRNPTDDDTNALDTVYVVRTKLPLTPPGTSPVPWPNDDDYQMRYWSLCNAIYARPYPTIADGCVSDLDFTELEETYPDIIDDERFVNIVVSTEAARPSNATPENGVIWIRGVEGVRNLLVLRNMLPSANFEEAAQNVDKDGSWQTAFLTMGEYYPAITARCTTVHFEENGWQGCVAPKGGGDEVLGPGVPGAAGP